MPKEQGYRVLMVDDDRGILEPNRTFFEQRGYEVVCATNARDAITAATSARFDCIILDIDLPDGDGFDVCTVVRETALLPIVFLSSYTEEENRIRGLSIGGDDYVCKPYSLVELEMRVRLRIRSHVQDHSKETLRFDKLVIDPQHREASYDGQSLELSCIEFDILYFLACRPEKIYSYEQIYHSVWHEPINMGRHSIQVRIGVIRKRLYELCPDKEYIRTIRQKGYQFMPSA